MAMTKKEREAFAALEKELALARAWKLTTPVETDVPPPPHSIIANPLTRGWNFSAYNDDVYKACSSSISHGRGWGKTTSQRPLPLYSTFELAKAALRYAVEREVLEKLARIDLLTEPTD